MYTVREFEPSAQAYEELAALHRVISPDGRQETAAGLEKEDADWPRDKLFKRFIATEDGGEYVAEGVCFEAYWQYRAGTVHLHFSIDPGHATGRVLPTLYTALLAFLDRRGARVDRLSCGASEEDAARIRFLRQEDFREEMRWPSSELRLAEFNAAGHAQYLEQVARAGIRILNLRQVKAEVSSWMRKLRDLRYELLQDVPSSDPPTKPTVAEFEEMILQDPALLEEGYFVALAEDGSFVGMCNLWRNDETGKYLDTGLTGVVRSYRRRKLGISLKLHTVRFAQSAGAETIRTRNEEDSPMFALNRKLGFRPKPAWISLQKR